MTSFAPHTTLPAASAEGADLLSTASLCEAPSHGPRILSLLLSGGMAGGLFVASVVAPAAQTIVGTWAPDPKICTPVAGMIDIGPLSLSADETRCTFRDVGRQGDVVTWHGACSDGITPTPATVTATLRYGTLTVLMNGKPSGTYRRCTPSR